MRIFDRINISTKVMTGFAIVVALLVIISAVSLIGLMGADTRFKDYRSLARQTNAKGRVQANMLMTRIYAKNFVINASKDNIEGVEQRARLTLEMIAETRELTIDPGFQMIVDNLDRELNEYLTQFDKVTALQEQRNALVHDTLNVIGPQMEKGLTAVMESAFADNDTEGAYRAGMTMRNLLLARLYAGRFLIRNDKASFQRVGKEFLEMQQNLDLLVSTLKHPERLELASKVRNDQRTYDRAFEDVHDVITSRNSIIRNQLDAIGPRVADQIEKLKLALKSEQDTLGPLAEAEIDQAVKVVMAVSIASILFGALAAWLIGLGVSRQIRSMAGTMKAVAGGDMSIEIDTDHGSDEIREMAAAVQVFKASLVKVRELAEEQRLTAEELRVARDAADTANQSKSAFLANMSHELRTPMNAILGYSEMLMEEAEDLEQEDFIPDLKKINQAGNHLLSLINDVLDLSKVESGKMEAFAEDIDIDNLIDEVSGTAQPLMEKNSNTLSIERSGQIGRAHQDLTKLRQCLFNLLSNAAKFTHDGTITLHIERTVEAGMDWLTLAVSDTGIGIPADKIDHVFEEFTQADDSTTRDYGGTGLGLAISRRFCELLGGSLRAASETGKGSTFTIRIPATLPGTKSQTPSAGTPAITETELEALREAGPGTTVLVIDDDPEACEIIERYLTKDGYSVATAASGEQGLRLAHEIQPAAITLDVMMPEMDGWSVLRALKADPLLRTIPVIMLSMIDDRTRGYSLGAVDYLTKPVDREQLNKTLSRYYCAEDDTCPVLLVEDDAETREVMARTLEKAGWTVSEAGNGQEALDIMSDLHPRLILLDLMMPVMDGFDFLTAMRARPEWQHIPVIVITAKDLTADVRDRLNGRVEEIVEKSAYTREQLLQRVSEAVAKCNISETETNATGKYDE
jgi:signal transduction histidine kinase/DNA-binding response OmpR family regulator